MRPFGHSASRGSAARTGAEVARFARLLLAFLWLAPLACGGHVVKLAVDPGAPHVRGEYMGSQRQVKLFVERLRLEPSREGRRGLSSAIYADLALLNERAGDAKLRTGAARIEVGGKDLGPVETHVINLRPADITRVSLTFKVPLAPEDFQGATIKVDVGSEQEPARFAVPFSVTE